MVGGLLGIFCHASLWFWLIFTINSIEGNINSFSLKTGNSKNMSCPYGIKVLSSVDSNRLNQYCNSSFHAWQLLCHDRTHCQVDNTCNQTMNMTYSCRERPFEVLITDPDPAGIRFSCSCNCTKNRHLNLTQGRKFTDLTCFCSCEDRLVPRFQLNSTDMNRRLEELKENLTVTKRQTSSYLRQRTSTMDYRTSSTTIGVFGALILAALVGSIILIDIPRLHRTFLRSKVYIKCKAASDKSNQQ